MNYGIRVKFVLFGIVALAIMLVLYNTMVNQVAGDSTEYRADFTSASGLQAGDDVRAAGIRVGRVNRVELVEGATARVTFVVGADQALTDTSRLTVRYQNLLGQRYLSLSPGEQPGEVLEAGATVPSERTDPGFDLTTLLNGFEPLFATLQPEDVNQLAGSIVAVMQGEGGTVESLLAETAELTSDLASKDEVFGQVLDRLTPVLENLTAQDQALAGTIDELKALMTGLAEDRQAIGGSLAGISELSTATADLLAEARPDAVSTISSLRDVADLFVVNADQLRELLPAMSTATGAFARPMNSGTWLNTYLCAMNIDLQGTPVPLGLPDRQFSQVCR
ncbi:virulence factor Mce family protein [Aeromicrobium marinum DSM 15272]|uniref:Virulence factor Mce family protein n=1 Tax=Aeromicrobium marinum DSM 15272 TaxID=585531 RepID=E2SCQ6_9ACTN|nr:MlaD family protein [Aeromicrobium marinum]EFQ83009.1 virulence factor Mce family protein [Aeromicrobium marinum DSM 15272]